MASGSGTARIGQKRSEINFIVVQETPNGKLIARRPTPLEALRAQGFPDDWLDGVEICGRPLSDAAKYRLIGNAWPVPVAAAIFSSLLFALNVANDNTPEASSGSTVH
jgi:site-specific DNA-cytosine methylase